MTVIALLATMRRQALRVVLAAGVILALANLAAKTIAADVEAWSGAPFGVGRITVPLGPESADIKSQGAFDIYNAEGRVLYPVFTTGRVMETLNRILGGGAGENVPPSVTALFLFTGEKPLRVTLYTPKKHDVVLVPQLMPRPRSRLLRRWSREYHLEARQERQRDEYPTILQTYLTTILSERMGVGTPLLAGDRPKPVDPPQESLDLLLGVEALEQSIMRETVLGRFDNEPARLPVPRAINWSPMAVPAAEPKVVIEPMAMRVPANCYYIRFGNFNNYLWFSNLLQEYGGDISRMAAIRGQDARINARIRDRLALKESALAEVLGPNVIADVAMIGRDLFMKDGPAMGILFKAKNNLLLSNDINGNRRTVLGKEKANGCTLTTEKISGVNVSVLKTPDNRVRSFYAIRDEYHLVTTLREIARSFLSVGKEGEGSLGESAEFRHARSLMPVSRDDTVFVYMSRAFFRGLLTPHYRIELRRRLQAVIDIQLVQLGRLAARAEGHKAETIEQIIRAGVLPEGFGRRSDGSYPVLNPDGTITDSLRGARGSFLPVPDTPFTGVTRDEATRYEEVANFHESKWKEMDPITAGIKRFALNDKGLERLTLDVRMSPFGEQKYGLLTSLLGPALTTKVTPAKMDVIFAQASLTGGAPFPQVPIHHMFFGVEDMVPPQSMGQGGLLQWLRLMKSAPLYIGAYPKPGYLDMLPFGLAGRPDENGFSQLPLGMWRLQFGNWSMVSAMPQLLADVAPQMQVVPAKRAAQIRIHAEDLSGTKIASLMDDLATNRAKQATTGNLRLIHTMARQFRIPNAEARKQTEQLLDAKLLCTLDGEYKPVTEKNGFQHWISTALQQKQPLKVTPPPPGAEPAPAAAAPGKEVNLQDDKPGHRGPILRWFRGVDADLLKAEGMLVVYAQLDMQRKVPETKIKLPLFNLFGTGKKDDKKEEKK